ncbi:GAF domain-containing protein [Kribbella sp. NPDC049174]|uniref:GAF domain-containing protein n=1 Tax=Kribbella sp. NPDC049174 TaxID=3364112 RepID=UPI0037245C2A
MAWTRLNLPIERWWRGLLTSVALVAVISGIIALVEPHLPALSLLVLYLFAVLPVAIAWGARLGALTSILSVGAFAFLFLGPVGSIWVAEARNAVALGVFLVTAVVVAELAARSRRAAMESGRLTTEQSGLRRIATLVAESVAPSAVFEAVTREVGLLCGADLARMERYEADGTVSAVAAWSRVPVQLAVDTRFDLEGLSVAREVRLTGNPVRVDSFAGATGEIAAEARALGIRSSIGCPIVVAGQVWGVIAASTKREQPFAANTESQIAGFTELVATAIENAESRAELRRMADEQAALRRVATMVAQGAGPDRVFAAVAEEVGALFDADATALVRFEPDGQATLVGGHGWLGGHQPGTRFTPPPGLALATVRDTERAARTELDGAAAAAASLTEDAWRQGIRSAVDLPIAVEGRLWGAINVASRRERLPPDTEQRMTDFTELVATTIANAEAHTKLTESRARIVTTADETRRRIERDLHDGAQQRLVSLALELRLLQDGVPAYLPVLRGGLGKISEDLTGVVDELREMARGIHPSVLSEGGLGAALRMLARRSAVPVELSIGIDSRYPPPIEVAAYYVVSEALTNATKHADASGAEVTIGERDGTLHLQVRDDGLGGAEPGRGSGLIGLRDRVEALGGSFDITSHTGDGTVIEVSLPLTPTDHPTPARNL